MVEYVREGEGFIAYERAPSGRETISSYEELQNIGQSWIGKTLVGMYNTLASTQGTAPVKKFTNHETGIKRLWSLLQELPVMTANSGGKRALVLDLVHRPSGAALEEIMTATGWQAHSVRGFLSVQRKAYTIERRSRADDLIAYYASKKANT